MRNERGQRMSTPFSIPEINSLLEHAARLSRIGVEGLFGPPGQYTQDRDEIHAVFCRPASEDSVGWPMSIHSSHMQAENWFNKGANFSWAGGRGYLLLSIKAGVPSIRFLESSSSVPAVTPAPTVETA